MSGIPAENLLVLITGGAGFIGTNLTKRLVAEGHRVRVLDNLLPQVHGDDPEKTSPLFAEVSELAEVRVGSITSREAIIDAIRDVDVIVHYAAETGTGQSMYEIERYVSVNVTGTALLLDVLANTTNSVAKVVVASSRSIYGEGRYTAQDGTIVYPPHRVDADMAGGDFDVHPRGSKETLTLLATDESSDIHPSSVYGITKQAQEQLVLTVCPTIGIAPVALRYQNVYGPGQSLSNPYTGILSIFSTLIRENKTINVFEDGLESRDFVYIDDVVDATYRAIIDGAADGRTYNVGSGVATTVLDVVDALTTAFGQAVPVTVTGNYRLGDIRHNYADLSAIESQLGFAPQVPFSEGVTRFVAWVLDQPQHPGAYEESLEEMRSRNLFK